MIRYSCDLCHRELDPASDARYVVNIEIHRELEPIDGHEDPDDRDYLGEIHEILEAMDDSPDAVSEVVKELRYDLCADCCKKFAKRPLGRESSAPLNFSPN